MVESTDAELWTGKANCKFTCGFSAVQRVGAPIPPVVQALTVVESEIALIWRSMEQTILRKKYIRYLEVRS